MQVEQTQVLLRDVCSQTHTLSSARKKNASHRPALMRLYGASVHAVIPCLRREIFQKIFFSSFHVQRHRRRMLPPAWHAQSVRHRRLFSEFCMRTNAPVNLFITADTRQHARCSILACRDRPTGKSTREGARNYYYLPAYSLPSA